MLTEHKKAAKKAGFDICWMDFSKIPEDSPLKRYTKEYIYNGSLGEGYGIITRMIPMPYRVFDNPEQSYDSMIYVSEDERLNQSGSAICAGASQIALMADANWNFRRPVAKRSGMEVIMSKKNRQILGVLAAMIFYYIIHEGAHLIAALVMGVFKEVKFKGLGIQVVVFASGMTDMQTGIFCVVGAASTLIAAWILILAVPAICKNRSKLVKAVFYYITIAMLLVDPLYLSVLCDFFGGGDMNGIKILIPEPYARMGFGVLLILNAILFWKRILPAYTHAFQNTEV